MVGAAAATLTSVMPASADGTVVVRGFGFPADGTSLSIVGCAGVYDRVPEPIPTFLSRSDDAPAGSRSLKYDLAGGNAVGSQHRFSSLASTTVAGLSLSAPDGASGVAYVGYRAPGDWASDLIWIGRAGLDEAAGGWRTVDVAELTYTWTQYHLSTQQPVSSGDEPDPASVPDFIAAHGGDGPGFFTVGFGCDGRPFKIDALRIGSPGAVTTYDLEGYTSVTDIAAAASNVVAGEGLTLNGTLLTGSGVPVESGLLVLEAQEWGAKGFDPVAVAEVQGGHASVVVHPKVHTVYRWRFIGSSSTDASTSEPIVVDVAPVVSAAPQGAGDDAAVTGSLEPAGAGVPVTLWRVTSKRPVMVGTVATAADGSYRIPVGTGVTGTWRYFVTVPAAEGRLAAQSPPVSVASSEDPTPSASPTAAAAKPSPTAAPSASPSAPTPGAASPAPVTPGGGTSATATTTAAAGAGT
jgi:hypothetical protein